MNRNDPAAIWWHIDDHKALNLSKASLGNFCYHALKLNIQIGNFWAFNSKYDRSWVGVTIKATKEQKEALETITKFKFNLPPKLNYT